MPETILSLLTVGREKLRSRRIAERKKKLEAMHAIRTAAEKELPELAGFLQVCAEDVRPSGRDGMVWIVLPGCARIGVAFSQVFGGAWERGGPYQVEPHFDCKKRARIPEAGLDCALALAAEYGQRQVGVEPEAEPAPRWWQKLIGA